MPCLMAPKWPLIPTICLDMVFFSRVAPDMVVFYHLKGPICGEDSAVFIMS